MHKHAKVCVPPEPHNIAHGANLIDLVGTGLLGHLYEESVCKISAVYASKLRLQTKVTLDGEAKKGIFYECVCSLMKGLHCSMYKKYLNYK